MSKILLVIFFFCISIISIAQDKIVHDLKIQGNEKLKTSFIKSFSNVKAGAILDSTLIEQDMLRLRRLPSVSYAYYQVFHSEDNKYNVFYNIEENFTLLPNLNIYTTSDKEIAYRAGLYEFNTLGKNILFGGFYQKDNFDSYAINFRAPYLFSNQSGIAANFQNLTTLEPVFFDNTTASYKYNNKSMEVLGLYEINFSNRIELGVNYFVEDYQYQFGATSPNIPQTLEVHKWLFKGIYEYNQLDYKYQYISGIKSQFVFQYVTSTYENLPSFLIAWNDLFYFKRLGNKGNWANRLRLGLATNDNSPFAPFSVDNNLNIRGVGNIIDRGTGVITLNTEYRHTLYEVSSFVFQSNVFVDAGTWRNPGGDYDDFLNIENARIFPGIGFRVIHKKIHNATFRIDYGHGITKNSSQGIVFGIGQYF